MARAAAGSDAKQNRKDVPEPLSSVRVEVSSWKGLQSGPVRPGPASEEVQQFDYATMSGMVMNSVALLYYPFSWTILFSVD